MIVERVREERGRPRRSPGTATPTAASSSTSEASSATATSSAPCSRGPRSPRSPGATILYDPRSSRAVPDTVAAAGGTLGPEPRRPRVLQGADARGRRAVFGGEVSGHYYFRDFYCADSGTIPALLMLELLSREGRSLAELMAEFRSRYFISGEINSEVADQEAKMEEIAERYSRRRDQPARRRLGRLPRLALQRPPLQHRAAAAAQPRVAGLAASTWREARRGPGVDQLVSDARRLRTRSEARPERRSRRTSRSGSRSPTPGSACCASRPRSRSAASTATCSRTIR